jgi:hypothetical protein
MGKQEFVAVGECHYREEDCMLALGVCLIVVFAAPFVA